MAVTTGTSGEEEERPVCNHGVSTTTAVIQTEGKCPHDDGALQSYVLCKGRVQHFQQKHDQTVIKVLDLDTDHYHNLDRLFNYKIVIKPGDDGSIFNFMNLCRSNGIHYLGNYPNNFEKKNCQNTFKVSLKLLENQRNNWYQKLSLTLDIKRCEHAERCKFENQEENNADSPKRNFNTNNLKLIAVTAVITMLLAILISFLTGADKNVEMSSSVKVGVQPGDDYLTALSTLWGEETLKQVREYVRRGDIKEPAIKTMAAKMDVLRVYQENWHKLGLVDTFESMLEEWFDQTLFDLEPADARQRLVTVLRDSGCSKKVVTHIQRLCDSY